MLTERIIIVAIVCVTLCVMAWVGTRNTKERNDDKKDGTHNER